MARLLSLAVLSLSAVLALASATPSVIASPNNIVNGNRLPFVVARGGSDAEEDQVGAAGATASSAAVSSIPSGGASSYSSQLEGVKATVLETASESIDELRRQILKESSIVEELGDQSDTICNKALEEFSKTAPEATSSDQSSAYERALTTLEAALDAPLQLLYLHQLALLREQALQRYRTMSKTSGASEYEAMLQADSAFVRGAEAATRDGWEYAAERTYLQRVMNHIAESGKQATDVQLKSAQQQQTAMQFLQQQQQMIQQLQQQLYGQSSPWNMGVAYRIPDTNFNLQGSYQQGRANVQLSCVPDEYAPFLGPNGFTNGVGPGNLGVSLNLSV